MYLVKNKKSPFYQIVYFVNGKRTTVSTKTKSKKEAEEFLLRFKNSKKQIEKKEVIKPKEPPKSISFSQFKTEYLKYVRSIKSKHYVKSIGLSFRQLENFLGDIPLVEIDTRTLDNFITTTFSRTERGAHLYYRTLKAAFTKAVSWDYINENPFKKITFPKVAKSHPVFISIEEFKLIRSYVNEEYLKDLFTVAFYTGMRVGEIVNMKCNWIDLSNNIITIRNGDDFKTKSKKERVIPFNQNLKAIFLKYISRELSLKNYIYVFTNKNGIKLNEDFVSKKFKKAVRKAGLSDQIHFHTLRHSFASLLVQKGVSLYIVKELLGHENLSTTQIYSHINSSNLKDAVNLL